MWVSFMQLSFEWVFMHAVVGYSFSHFTFVVVDTLQPSCSPNVTVKCIEDYCVLNQMCYSHIQAASLSCPCEHCLQRYTGGGWLILRIGVLLCTRIDIALGQRVLFFVVMHCVLIHHNHNVEWGKVNVLWIAHAHGVQ